MIGAVLDTLESLSIREKTVVFFSGDNGTLTSTNITLGNYLNLVRLSGHTDGQQPLLHSPAFQLAANPPASLSSGGRAVFLHPITDAACMLADVLNALYVCM